MMIKAVPFFASFLTAVSMLIGVYLGGWFTFLTPVIVFLGLPAIDLIVGHDLEDTQPDEGPNALFDGVVRLWVPTQIAVLAVVLSVVAFGEWTTLELVGMLISTGLVTAGGAINAAHELMHRKSALDRGLAEILMTTASYTHFCIEHVHGHHKNVSTPLDPASSRLGQSLYAYYPQTVIGGFKSAVSIERARNERRGVPVLTWRNRLTRYAVVGVLSYAFVGAVFGLPALAFYAVQGIIAFTVLEVINYVEHYGLERAQTAPGRYEKVEPRHSWNANHRVSNWWLFNLQRHADHHALAHRPFYNLRAIEEGPQLPFSYPMAILVALVPPLWRSIMDERVLATRPAAQKAA